MSNKLPETSGPEEVDLGQLFKLIGKAFERFFKFLGGIFNALAKAFVWLIFFLKKNIIVLFTAGLIGFIIGFVQEMTADPIYVSKATVNQNYQTGENLSNSIEYYNSLIFQENIDLLAEELNINSEQASALMGFEMKSVATENQKLQAYNSYIKTLDSTIAANIDYDLFIENIEDYSYSTQQLAINSRNADENFKIFDKVIERTSNSAYYKREQENDLIELDNTRKAILNGLEESKELQITYKKVLEAATETKEMPRAQTSITIEGSDQANTTKEFELYKNNLQLRRELVVIEREKENKKEIIEITSLSQTLASNNIEILGKSINKKVVYGMMLALLTFLVMLGTHFLRYIESNYNVEN